MMPALATVGGKAANLIRLREAGFDVPAFVVLDTAEYHAFVAAHQLEPLIEEALTLGDPAEASDRIRAAFRRPMDEAQSARITALIAPVAGRAVAVRSSATAEDLPELSFAGQQDSFLDIRGDEAIRATVIECWSSAWTERAIAYRRRNDVGDALAVAVIVQEFVAAEAAGVLFTADPLTGHRGHAVLDAVFGLGEALVSGQVTPDNVVIDTATGTVLTRTIQGDRPALEDAPAVALVELGRRVAALMGQPCDIEWVRVGERLRLVQARPITSLYPLPAGEPDALWLSFGAFQGMLEPITPLGQDLLAALLSGAAGAFGRTVDPRTNPYLAFAGDRIWVRTDALLRLRIGRRLLPRALPLADPGVAALTAELAEEPIFTARSRFRPAGARRVLGTASRFARPVLTRIPRSLRRPEAARSAVDDAADGLLTELERRLRAADGIDRVELRLAARGRALDWFARAGMSALLPVFGPILLPSVLMLGELRRLAAESGLDDAESLVLGLLRSLPGNVTAEMDRALYGITEAIRSDPDSLDACAGAEPEALAEAYRAGALPTAVQQALAGFLDRYGMRGVAEIDLGAPRWSDDPTAVLRTAVSYLDLDPDAGPAATDARGRREAEADIERLAEALAARGQRAKAARARFLGDRVRRLMGARETPKFTLVKGFGLLREALRDSGQDLVGAGVLGAGDDIFFLRRDELTRAFAGGPLTERVAHRRAGWEREHRRTRIPLAMVGDGRTFYARPGGTSAADLTGTGVSPGVVDGTVRVVHHPRSSALRPGEILVCRGTDPAWTPLFLTAAGLITEVGGLMTHGSVVAREYGLPAVVGVGDATHLLTDGERIRLDGTAGTITRLTQAQPTETSGPH